MEDAKKKRGNRGLLVFLGCIFFVICGLAAAIIVVNNRTVDEGIDENGLEPDESFGGWAEYIANKDAEGLIEVTNRQIESTDDLEVKSVIYASRAGVLSGFGDEDGNNRYAAQILADAYSAEEYYPTGQTAYLIYLYELTYGNSAVAEKYLKIVEERGATIPLGGG